MPFHEAQWEAWNSEARFVFVFAGTQGGKTAFGPTWLLREVQRGGAGDYLAATATYDLFKLKMLPSLRRLFEYKLGIARYWPGLKVMELCNPKTMHFYAEKADDPMWGRIILRSAQAEGGLESSTAKAAWLDECGMDEFRVSSWEAVQRRLSINEGRVLGTTTLYNRGWTKTEVHDRWKAGDKTIAVVQFASFKNPAFPQAEFDRIVARLPRWKVNMFYKGQFDVPEGLVYGIFDTEQDVCDPFPIPPDWKLYGGLDFGGTNTGAVLFAERPQDRHLFLCREYLRGERTAAAHAKELLDWKAKRWWGGSRSEEQWRREFGQAGMPVLRPAVSDVQVGIDACYGVLAEHGMTVFRSCTRWLDEVGTYSRELDEAGNPTDDLLDPHAYHLLDATRYALPAIRPAARPVRAIRLNLP